MEAEEETNPFNEGVNIFDIIYSGKDYANPIDVDANAINNINLKLAIPLHNNSKNIVTNEINGPNEKVEQSYSIFIKVLIDNHNISSFTNGGQSRHSVEETRDLYLGSLYSANPEQFMTDTPSGAANINKIFKDNQEPSSKNLSKKAIWNAILNAEYYSKAMEIIQKKITTIQQASNALSVAKEAPTLPPLGEENPLEIATTNFVKAYMGVITPEEYIKIFNEVQGMFMSKRIAEIAKLAAEKATAATPLVKPPAPPPGNASTPAGPQAGPSRQPSAAAAGQQPQPAASGLKPLPPPAGQQPPGPPPAGQQPQAAEAAEAARQRELAEAAEAAEKKAAAAETARQRELAEAARKKAANEKFQEALDKLKATWGKSATATSDALTRLLEKQFLFRILHYKAMNQNESEGKPYMLAFRDAVNALVAKEKAPGGEHLTAVNIAGLNGLLPPELAKGTLATLLKNLFGQEDVITFSGGAPGVYHWAYYDLLKESLLVPTGGTLTIDELIAKYEALGQELLKAAPAAASGATEPLPLGAAEPAAAPPVASQKQFAAALRGLLKTLVDKLAMIKSGPLAKVTNDLKTKVTTTPLTNEGAVKVLFLNTMIDLILQISKKINNETPKNQITAIVENLLEQLKTLNDGTDENSDKILEILAQNGENGTILSILTQLLEIAAAKEAAGAAAPEALAAAAAAPIVYDERNIEEAVNAAIKIIIDERGRNLQEITLTGETAKPSVLRRQKLFAIINKFSDIDTRITFLKELCDKLFTVIDINNPTTKKSLAYILATAAALLPLDGITESEIRRINKIIDLHEKNDSQAVTVSSLDNIINLQKKAQALLIIDYAKQAKIVFDKFIKEEEARQAALAEAARAAAASGAVAEAGLPLAAAAADGAVAEAPALVGAEGAASGAAALPADRAAGAPEELPEEEPAAEGAPETPPEPVVAAAAALAAAPGEGAPAPGPPEERQLEEAAPAEEDAAPPAEEAAPEDEEESELEDIDTKLMSDKSIITTTSEKNPSNRISFYDNDLAGKERPITSHATLRRRDIYQPLSTPALEKAVATSGSPTINTDRLVLTSIIENLSNAYQKITTGASYNELGEILTKIIKTETQTKQLQQAIILAFLYANIVESGEGENSYSTLTRKVGYDTFIETLKNYAINNYSLIHIRRTIFEKISTIKPEVSKFINAFRNEITYVSSRPVYTVGEAQAYNTQLRNIFDIDDRFKLTQLAWMDILGTIQDGIPTYITKLKTSAEFANRAAINNAVESYFSKGYNKNKLLELFGVSDLTGILPSISPDASTSGRGGGREEELEKFTRVLLKGGMVSPAAAPPAQPTAAQLKEFATKLKEQQKGIREVRETLNNLREKYETYRKSVKDNKEFADVKLLTDVQTAEFGDFINAASNEQIFVKLITALDSAKEKSADLDKDVAEAEKAAGDAEAKKVAADAKKAAAAAAEKAAGEAAADAAAADAAAAEKAAGEAAADAAADVKKAAADAKKAAGEAAAKKVEAAGKATAAAGEATAAATEKEAAEAILATVKAYTALKDFLKIDKNTTVLPCLKALNSSIKDDKTITRVSYTAAKERFVSIKAGNTYSEQEIIGISDFLKSNIETIKKSNTELSNKATAKIQEIVKTVLETVKPFELREFFKMNNPYLLALMEGTEDEIVVKAIAIKRDAVQFPITKADVDNVNTNMTPPVLKVTTEWKRIKGFIPLMNDIKRLFEKDANYYNNTFQQQAVGLEKIAKQKREQEETRLRAEAEGRARVARPGGGVMMKGGEKSKDRELLDEYLNTTAASGTVYVYLSIFDYLEAISGILNSYVKRLDNISDPAASAALSGDKSIFNLIFEKYTKAKETSATDPATTEYEATNALVGDLETNNLIPRDVLKVTMRDKVVFIFATLFMRLICMSILEYLIEKGLLRTLLVSSATYLGIFTLFFIGFVFLINMDMYRLRIVFNYVNFHGSSSNIYMYLILLWSFGLVVYFIMRSINRGVTVQTTNDEGRARLMYRMQVLSLIVWLFLVLMVAII